MAKQSRAPYYIKLHIGDYERDTVELSPLQDGVYFRLMRWYYATGKPIPNDLQRIYRRIHALSVEECDAVRYVLENFFILEGPVWRQRRIDQELEEWESRSEAGKANAEHRWNKPNENKEETYAMAMRSQCDGNANQNQNQNQNLLTSKLWKMRNFTTIKANAEHRWNKPNENKEETYAMAMRSQCDGNANQNQNQNQNLLTSKPTPLSGKPDDMAQTLKKLRTQSALEILQFLNEKTGRNFRPVEANLKLIIARLKQGYTPAQCRAVIARKRREWATDPEMEKFLRPATLFNDTKFNQYVADVPDPEASNETMS